MFHLAPLYEKGGLIMSNSSSSDTLSPNTWLERQFHLTARHSSIKTEFLSGFEEIKTLREQQRSDDTLIADAMEQEVEELCSEGTTKRALIVDAIGTIMGAILRCTTITSFIESSAGAESGGRTGLSAIFTGSFFALSIIFASIFTTVPGLATGPALMAVGCSMIISAFSQLDLDRDKLHELIPGVCCMIATALTYNIANGMAVGIMFYVRLTFCTKHRREISPLLYVLTLILLVKFRFL